MTILRLSLLSSCPGGDRLRLGTATGPREIRTLISRARGVRPGGDPGGVRSQGAGDRSRTAIAPLIWRRSSKVWPMRWMSTNGSR